MCGIAGIFAYHYAANPIDRPELTKMRDHMAARGPDGAGVWFAQDGRVGLGHRRLAIIDLSEAGAQPMASTDGMCVVTFNGEIYNYLELRRSLEAKGVIFHSTSDTEVLLHLYAAHGAEMVHQLRGMFAFAIWDARQGKLFLARDPLGIKPLYYSDDGWCVRFASQVKALLSTGAISRESDAAGWVGYYLLGSVPEPYTTFRAIRQVPAGSTLTIDRLGAGAPQRYHSVAEVYSRAERHWTGSDATDRCEQLHEALRDSVRHHLVSDVPVGAFLSAGIDSGAIVGLMRDAGVGDLQTVTLAFDEFRGQPTDESILSAEVARRYGSRHTTRVVTEQEFRADLPRFLAAMDQPTIDGINTWFASKAARELGLKVVVSGLGGDELFGGYPSFRDVPRWVRWLRVPGAVPGLGRAVRRAAMAFGPYRLGASPKAAGMVEFGSSYGGAYLLKRGLFMPWELEEVLDRDLAREGLRRLRLLETIDHSLKTRLRQPFSKVATLETSWYMRNQLLRDTDWASMAHGLEVRVPLVDSTLLSVAAPLLTPTLARQGKHILGSSPSVCLPAAVRERSKTGFTTPVASWLMREGPTRSFQHISSLAAAQCPWARRWAYGVAAA